jgi:hypothetical protein
MMCSFATPTPAGAVFVGDSQVFNGTMNMSVPMGGTSRLARTVSFYAANQPCTDEGKKAVCTVSGSGTFSPANCTAGSVIGSLSVSSSKGLDVEYLSFQMNFSYGTGILLAHESDSSVLTLGVLEISPLSELSCVRSSTTSYQIYGGWQES